MIHKWLHGLTQDWVYLRIVMPWRCNVVTLGYLGLKELVNSVLVIAVFYSRVQIAWSDLCSLTPQCSEVVEWMQKMDIKTPTLASMRTVLPLLTHRYCLRFNRNILKTHFFHEPLFNLELQVKTCGHLHSFQRTEVISLSGQVTAIYWLTA